jgi:hypothetical protein
MVDSIPFSRVVPIDVGAQPTWIGDSFVSACFKEHNLLIESIGADGRIKLSQFSYAADKICHRQYDQTGDQLIGCDLVTKTSSY